MSIGIKFKRQEQISNQIYDIEEESRKRLDDQYDVVKFLCDVENGIKKNIGSDYTLARLEPKQREFITQQTKIAFIMNQITPDKRKGANIFDTIMVENTMIAILHRNVDQNILLEIIGGARERAITETPQKESIIQKTLSRFKKEKKEKEE